MLTIEQLKELPHGDWLWVVDLKTNTAMYGQILVNGIIGDSDCRYLCIDGRNAEFDFSTYGIKWTAYKNKEEAEGKSITLPYLLCTSSKFACVIWRDTDGKVKKTHTYPVQEAKAILREKEQLLVCKP